MDPRLQKELYFPCEIHRYAPRLHASTKLTGQHRFEPERDSGLVGGAYTIFTEIDSVVS